MTARKYLKSIGGFTLVELLIVIALLAIIALIVIAAINPIEQANRARDTGMRSDAAQLISAVDRYYASKQEFPWVTDDITVGVTDEDSLGFMSVDTDSVGLCIDTVPGDCAEDGALMVAEELKPEFKNRSFVGASTAEDQLWIGKRTGASESVYICYIPKAKSNRTKAIDNEQVYALALDGTFDVSAEPECQEADLDWVDGLCYVCIPE